jgi:hypothetical protein
MFYLLLIAGLLVACGDKDDESSSNTDGGGDRGASGGPGGGPGGGDGEGAVAAVVSPEDGATFMAGDAVTLEVTLDGAAPEGAEWSITGTPWVASGSPVTVSDLPEGELRLEVEAWSGGGSAVAQVDITVEPREPVSYAGEMSATVEVDSPYYSADSDCPGPVSFVWDTDNTLWGTGSCYYDFDIYDDTVRFELFGQVEGGAVTGTLTSDLDDEGMDFTGTVGADGLISASFDKTWSEGEGSLRIWGTLSASPE